MNVLVALDSFKGSLTSLQAGKAVKKGILSIFPKARITLLPLADGGEGTLEALMMALKGEIHTAAVTGPRSEPVLARYGLCKSSAVIEMAQSSGLIQIHSAPLCPRQAVTTGLGELISKALDHGVKEIILGLGGSATTEAGIGMLQALGARFLDKQGNELPPFFDSLAKTESIDLKKLDPRLKEVSFVIACDVDNPLTGKNGAIAVFGPQKGVREEEIEEMDQAMDHFADITARTTGKDLRHLPGTGAAGGLGFALLSFFDQVRFVSGADLILERLDFRSRLEKADILVTGEGRIDGQSISGKGPVALCRLAKQIRPDILTLALAGSLSSQVQSVLDQGVDDCFCILQNVQSLSEAMDPETASNNLTACTEEIFRLIERLERAHG